MIKLIASDMDGTLLDDEKRLPPDFFEVLAELRRLGVHFVAASGRSYVTLKDNFSPHEGMLDYICDNGSFVVIDGVIESVDIIDTAVMREFVVFCHENLPDVEMTLCGVNGTYHSNCCEGPFLTLIKEYYVNQRGVDSLLDVEDDIFKIAICDRSGPQNGNAQLLSEHFRGKLDIVISGSVWMDASNCGVDKGRALKLLQQKLSITYEETMAFGDFHNDISMLGEAYYSYAMQNASDEIKKYARFVAGANREYGVMTAIKELVLR